MPSPRPSIEPRGLSRIEAARYIGVSPSLFDAMVADGRMPAPVRVNRRIIWDRRKLDDAFDALDDARKSDMELAGNPYLNVAL